MAHAALTPPVHATAALMLEDGSVFFGQGIGVKGTTLGEICFNTGLTGYQETMTDPSYAGQIITFTFPHIGNIGANAEDMESKIPAARGFVVRQPITSPSNFRSDNHLQAWLEKHELIGISGVDTRALTRKIRTQGAQNAIIHHFGKAGEYHPKALLEQVQAHPSLKGMELAKEVTCKRSHGWKHGVWQLGPGHEEIGKAKYKVVAVDYGAKLNILRCLVEVGCDVTVVPSTATAESILEHKPDGVFLSNGPGDPAATGEYAIPELQKLIQTGTPIFGICLGHQLLGRAMGCVTTKMHQGHRGCNHPVQDLATGKVEITSQNHGFMISKNALPDDVRITHVSLFDDTIEGIESKTKPVFSVQYHPEASPGPHDSFYLFERFAKMMEKKRV